MHGFFQLFKTVVWYQIVDERHDSSLAGKSRFPESRLEGHQFGNPIKFTLINKLNHLSRRITGSIKRSDNTSHACSGDNLWKNPVVMQRLQHSYMSKTQSATSTQTETYRLIGVIRFRIIKKMFNRSHCFVCDLMCKDNSKIFLFLLREPKKYSF